MPWDAEVQLQRDLERVLSEITRMRTQRQAQQARQRMVADVAEAIPDSRAVPEIRNATWRMEKGPRIGPDQAAAMFGRPGRDRQGIWDVGLRRTVMEQLTPQHAIRGDLGSTVGPRLARSAYDLHALFGTADAARDRAVSVGILCKRDERDHPEWVELAAACTGDGWHDVQRHAAGRLGMRIVEAEAGEDATLALLRNAGDRGLTVEAVSSSRSFEEPTRQRIQEEIKEGVLGEVRPRSLTVGIPEQQPSQEVGKDRWTSPRLETALREREDIPQITNAQANVLREARRAGLEVGKAERQALKRWEHDRLKPDTASIRGDDPEAKGLARLAHDLQWLFNDDRGVQGRRIAIAEVCRQDPESKSWATEYVAACSSNNWARMAHEDTLGELGIRQIVDTEPNEHAEQSLLRDAREKGLQVQSVGVSGRICDERRANCRGALETEFTRQRAESKRQIEERNQERFRQVDEQQRSPTNRNPDWDANRYTRRDPGREIS
jgi:hypothetical protein